MKKKDSTNSEPLLLFDMHDYFSEFQFGNVSLKLHFSYKINDTFPYALHFQKLVKGGYLKLKYSSFSDE